MKIISKKRSLHKVGATSLEKKFSSKILQINFRKSHVFHGAGIIIKSTWWVLNQTPVQG